MKGSGTEGRQRIVRLGDRSWMLRRDDLFETNLTGSVIGAFFEVYNTLGFGFNENVHAAALELELLERGHSVRRETPVPIFYKSIHLCTYRIDMLVNDQLIIEIKSGGLLPRSAAKQLYNYLKATSIEVGLLLHFGPEPKFYRQQLHTRKGLIELPPDSG